MESTLKGLPNLDLFDTSQRSKPAAAMAHLSSLLDEAFPQAPRGRADGGSPLSERECELVELVAQGLENKEIAERVFLSANTVRNHLHSIFNKLHLSERFEIALWKVGREPECDSFLGRENRERRRFQIQQPVRYRVLNGPRVGASGVGRAMNISSSGLWFTAEEALDCGERVKLLMDWPVKLNAVLPLQLAIEGLVTRSGARGAALSVARYEFRIRSTGHCTGRAA